MIKNMKNVKIDQKTSEAAIVRNGEVIALVKTNLKNGEYVKFGSNFTIFALHADKPKVLVNAKIGKISRAKKYIEAKPFSRFYTEDSAKILDSYDDKAFLIY